MYFLSVANHEYFQFDGCANTCDGAPPPLGKWSINTFFFNTFIFLPFKLGVLVSKLIVLGYFRSKLSKKSNKIFMLYASKKEIYRFP